MQNKKVYPLGDDVVGACAKASTPILAGRGPTVHLASQYFRVFLRYSLASQEQIWLGCAWCATCYTSTMIVTWRHKGLKRFYETGSRSGIQPAHANRLRMQLAALETAHSADDMDIPGFRLHPLKGSDRGRWSIWVSGNWRLTFEIRDGNVHVLDYEDYH